VHRVGDVETLTGHITQLYEDPALLRKLRAKSLSTVDQITWTAAGQRLLDLYREIITKYREERLSMTTMPSPCSWNSMSVS
jgi:hypothetical protein